MTATDYEHMETLYAQTRDLAKRLEKRVAILEAIIGRLDNRLYTMLVRSQAFSSDGGADDDEVDAAKDELLQLCGQTLERFGSSDWESVSIEAIEMLSAVYRADSTK